MKISSEVKIGVIGILTFAVLIWGINYLKGRNILGSTYALHAAFSDAGGIEASGPVLMNGVKIGYIKELDLIPGEPYPIKVNMSIEKHYPIEEGSKAVLFSSDLLGTKAIRIDPSGTRRFLSDNDTIRSCIETDMISSLQAGLLPVIEQVSSLAVSLDSLTSEVSQFVGSDDIKETMGHLASISESLKNSLTPGGSLNTSFENLESFTSVLKEQEDEFGALTTHLQSISQKIDSAGVDKLTGELLSMSSQFNQLLHQINSGEGTAGKLIHEESLYVNLDQLVNDLNALIRDLNENPQDYVQISLFGKSRKKNK